MSKKYLTLTILIPLITTLIFLVVCWAKFHTLQQTGFPLIYDSAFHYRISESLVTNGHMPQQDALFVQSPSRNPSQMCPPVLYYLIQWSYDFTQLWSPVSFPDFIRLLGIVINSLPIFAFAWFLWAVARRGFITIFGTFLFAGSTNFYVSFLPNLIRFETLSLTLCLSTAALFFLWQDALSRFRKSIILIALVFVFFVGAGLWRLFIPVASLISICWFLEEFTNNSRPIFMAPSLASALGAALAFVWYDFYRLGDPSHWLFLFPALLLPLLYLLISNGASIRLRGRFSMRNRCLFLLAAGVAVLLMGMVTIPVLKIRLDAFFHSGPLPLNVSSLYGYLVNELLPISLSTLFQIRYLFYLPVLYLLLFWFWWKKADTRPHHLFLSFTVLIFTVATLFFARFISLLFPFLLAHLLISSNHVIASFLGGMKKRNRVLLVHGLLILLFFPALVGWIIQNDTLCNKVPKVFLDRQLCYAWLKQNTPSNDVVITHYGLGYETETFAGCRVVMDGYLENSVNRQRILQFMNALFSTNEQELADFCRQFRSRYLLLNSEYLAPICERLKWPHHKWFTIQKKENHNLMAVHPEGRRITFIRLLFFADTSTCFKPVFSKGNYIIFWIQPHENTS